MNETWKDVVGDPNTLSPLSNHPNLYNGLIAVTVIGFLSFLAPTALFLRLAYELATRKRRAQNQLNQFFVLVLNLIFADIQQALGFLLSIRWLDIDSLTAGSSACRAQGWFISTGELAGGVFTLAIAVLSFLDIVCNFRLGRRVFIAVISALWIFVYLCAVIGVSLHPQNLYARAGAWCWISRKYTTERIYLAYLWVILTELGTIFIYAMIFLILQRRAAKAGALFSTFHVQARSAANLIVVYPCVYVVCTLPLVIVLVKSMCGHHVSFTELCVAGAMVTSTGWLDVLLYTLTRRALLFGAEASDDQARALDTFLLRPDQGYGTTTVIEAGRRVRPRGHEVSKSSSTERLFATQGPAVKAETTVMVRRDTVKVETIGLETGDTGTVTPAGSYVETQKADT